LVAVRNVDDLVQIARVCNGTRAPIVVMGRGSNMLVADAGFAGLCVVLGEFASGVEVVDRTGDTVRVRAGGATPLPVAARQLSALGVAGFEWAVGVPGTVGGAVRTNAGGHGSDMIAALVDAEIVDVRTGNRALVPANELGLRFRGSDLADHHVVVAAQLRLTASTPGVGDAAIADIVR
ncbi:MAG: FAD-binding protein, partial [Actinomycetota bacterium]